MVDLALSTPVWLAASAIVVNALVGALRGYMDETRGWDVVGVVSFALVMGLGGGLIRDVLLGDLPPQSLRTAWPIVGVLSAVVVARFVARAILRFPLVFGSLDALALALFAMTGAASAIEHGLPAVSAGLVGVLSAVGGGVLVSILRGEVPSILQPGRPNALLAAAVGVCYLVLSIWNSDVAYVVSSIFAVALFLWTHSAGVETRSLAANVELSIKERKNG